MAAFLPLFRTVFLVLPLSKHQRMDEYAPEPGSDEFKRFALQLVLEILTEMNFRTKSEIFGGMHATTLMCKKVFFKHHDTQKYKRDARFAAFCNGKELSLYFDTVRRLVSRAPNARPESIIQGKKNRTRRFIQEWNDDNQELVEEKREAIHSLVLTAFEVIWDIRRGVNEEAVVEEFQSDRRIVEADECLVSAVFQPAQISNMYAVVCRKKGAACGLDILAKNRLLGEEESSYRWDIVSLKYNTHMPAVSRPHRQHLAAIENEVQARDDHLDQVVDHIERSADVDTICNEELRPNIDNSRVCEAALRRLEHLLEVKKYISVKELVHENAAELIPLAMSRHESNKAIQECGLMLLVCRQSGLAKTLYHDALNVEECIFTAMVNFPDELNFCRCGLELMLILQDCARENDSLESWYLKMVDSNALDILITALKIHATHFFIVKCSLTLLGNILGGSDNVSDRKNLVGHNDLCSVVNDASEMRNTVRRAYNIQKEDKPEKATEELKPLRKRVVSLSRLLRRHDTPPESP